MVEVEPGDFRTAATLLDLPTTAAALATLDRRQGMAADHYGIDLFLK